MNIEQRGNRGGEKGRTLDLGAVKVKHWMSKIESQ